MVTNSMVTITSHALENDIRQDWMPMVLAPEDNAKWLTGPPNDAFALIKLFPAERMMIHKA